MKEIYPIVYDGMCKVDFETIEEKGMNLVDIMNSHIANILHPIDAVRRYINNERFDKR